MNASDPPCAPADLDDRLQALECGDLSPDEARALFQSLLRDPISEDTARTTYASLKTWAGRTLRSAIPYDVLVAWHNLLTAVAAQFQGSLREWGIRLEVIADLLHERAAMARARRPDDVLARKHAQILLRYLAQANGIAVARPVLETMLGLDSESLARTGLLLTDAGLLLRHDTGKAIAYSITAAGYGALLPPADFA